MSQAQALMELEPEVAVRSEALPTLEGQGLQVGDVQFAEMAKDLAQVKSLLAQFGKLLEEWPVGT